MKLTEEEKHQKQLAKIILSMPDGIPGSDSGGGMSDEEARKILGKLTKKELEEEAEKL